MGDGKFGASSAHLPSCFYKITKKPKSVNLGGFYREKTRYFETKYVNLQFLYIFGAISSATKAIIQRSY